MDASRFEWDDVKDTANYAKHGITFLEASAVFLDPHSIEEDSTRPEFGEERRKAIGSVGGRVVALIYTLRNDRRRLISARRARPNERREYNQSSSIV